MIIATSLILVRNNICIFFILGTIWESLKGLRLYLHNNWYNIKDKEPPEGAVKRKDLPKNLQ